MHDCFDPHGVCQDVYKRNLDTTSEFEYDSISSDMSYEAYASSTWDSESDVDSSAPIDLPPEAYVTPVVTHDCSDCNDCITDVVMTDNTSTNMLYADFWWSLIKPIVDSTRVFIQEVLDNV